MNTHFVGELEVSGDVITDTLAGYGSFIVTLILNLTTSPLSEEKLISGLLFSVKLQIILHSSTSYFLVNNICNLIFSNKLQHVEQYQFLLTSVYNIIFLFFHNSLYFLLTEQRTSFGVD